MTGGEYGKIFKRVWGDADFKALTCQQQLLYLKLVSQTDISLAGVLTLATIRWRGRRPASQTRTSLEPWQS